MGRTELSQLLRESGDAAAADAELDAAIKLNREVAANWFSQTAHRLYVEKKWAKSLEFYRRALDIDPLRAGQRPIYVGLLRMWLGETDAATEEMAASIDGKKFQYDEWDLELARFIAGRITEDQLFELTKTKDDAKTKGRLCEATCFAAERRHAQGDASGAKELYRRCVDLEQKNYLETWVAQR